jgi:chloramphenicol O-acetyltransferase type A
MAARIVDLATWPRADQFRFFRGYERPHYATTARVDVTHLLSRKTAGVSPYRGSLFAIGTGIHAVPELCMRFRGEEVTQFDGIALSMTVPTVNGSFRYAYVPYDPDFAVFDTEAARLIEEAAAGGTLNANTEARADVAYLSCMPWLDYSAINNALPNAMDCIPRVSWGKFVQGPEGRWSMAMTIEVHHALVDGQQVGQFFQAVQQSADSL